MPQTSPYGSWDFNSQIGGFYSLNDPFSQTSQNTSKPAIWGVKSPKSPQKSQMNIEQQIKKSRTRRRARALDESEPALARRRMNPQESDTIEISQPLAYSFACRLYDEGAAVLPFKNTPNGMLTVKGARAEALEFNAPGNMLQDFWNCYGCKPDGWAVLTGPHGYIVIDCEDDETYRIASKRFPYTRKTFGSKGGHIHLRVAGSVDRRQYYKDGCLLFEVLSNWMVTLPGSIHRKTGKPYRLLADAPVHQMSLEDFEARVVMVCMELGIAQET